jgi:hypothetical protein
VLFALAVPALAVPALAQRPRPADPVGAFLRMSPPVRVGFAATFGPVVLVGPFDPAPEVGFSVMAAGLVLGPVAGYAYAGDLGGAVPGLLWRSGAAAASYVYLDRVAAEAREDGLGGIVIVMFSAVPVAVGWTVLLTLDLMRLERRWEASRARQRFTVAPWVVPGGGAGLRVRIGR